MNSAGASRRGTRLALGLWVASVTLAGLGSYLQWVNRATTLPLGVDAGASISFFVAMLVFTTTGAVVAAKRPGNPVGWILLAEGLAWQLFEGIAGHYRIAALFTHELPGGAWTAWAWGWSYVPAVALVPGLLLVFPDGHLPSRRWRPVVGLLVAGAGVLLAALMLRPGPLPNTPSVVNPLGVPSAQALLPALEVAGNLAIIVAFVAGAASLVFRFRRADDVQRHQLKWIAYAAVLILLAWLVALVLDIVAVNVNTGSIRVPSLLALPVAVGIAVLRYRLYDIDVVISKTVVFAGLAGFITATYVAIVVGVGSLLGAGDSSNLSLSIVATAVVAVAFQPVRERLTRVANRLVYGRRATPYEVLSRFSSQVGETVATEQTLEHMARLLVEGTGAARAQVWLKVDGRMRSAASWPAQAVPDFAPLVLANGSLPEFAEVDLAVPVSHDGQLLGALTITKKRGEPVTPTEHSLIEDLAGQAGLVVRNVGLTAELRQRLDELRDSRRRLVEAQDGERRRLERDCTTAPNSNSWPSRSNSTWPSVSPNVTAPAKPPSCSTH